MHFVLQSILRKSIGYTAIRNYDTRISYFAAYIDNLK